MDLFSKAQEAVDHIFPLVALPPTVGIILGSGLGGFAAQVVGRGVDSVCGDSAFSAVDSGRPLGRAGAGNDWRHAVAVMQGRVHAYEGYSDGAGDVSDAGAGAAGLPKLIVTNAAGGIRANIPEGSLVAISDHINLTGTNAAMGTERAALCVRGGCGAAVLRYDHGVLAGAAEIGTAEAEKQGFALSEGRVSGGAGAEL
jgi:purine-nucleoside phosphorylase